MKKLIQSAKTPTALLLCLAMLLCCAASPASATSVAPAEENTALIAPPNKNIDGPDDPPSELPVSAGVSIGTLNQYSMEYARCCYDKELGKLVMTFRLSDAGTIEALLSYCQPFWNLADDVEQLKAANPANMNSDETQALMRVKETLNELLLNAGGGPDYRYVEQDELIETAEKTISSDEYQAFTEAVKPLMDCQKTDARSLMLAFTEEELAKICDALRANAYGEWSLRLEWLDEMEFSVLLPIEVAAQPVQ